MVVVFKKIGAPFKAAGRILASKYFQQYIPTFLKLYTDFGQTDKDKLSKIVPLLKRPL